MSFERILEPYKEYFWDFYNSLSKDTKEKTDYVLQIIISSPRVPSRFFKHLKDGLYEIRFELRERIGFAELRFPVACCGVSEHKINIQLIDDSSQLCCEESQFSGNTYRIFSFFDENNMVILLHGFQKKSQKTPRKEIERALELRRNYYVEKESKDR